MPEDRRIAASILPLVGHPTAALVSALFSVRRGIPEDGLSAAVELYGGAQGRSRWRDKLTEVQRLCLAGPRRHAEMAQRYGLTGIAETTMQAAIKESIGTGASAWLSDFVLIDPDRHLRRKYDHRSVARLLALVASDRVIGWGTRPRDYGIGK